MADASYSNTKVYIKQGGDELVVASGGKVTIETGGTIGPEAGPAGAIADITLTGTAATDAPIAQAAINSILAAIRAAGIVAAI